MYSGFDQILLNNQEKEFVRTNREHSDAQKIWESLVEYMQRSTKASIDTADLLSYLTTFCLGLGSSWSGTYKSFIIHWGDKVHIYNENVEGNNGLGFAQCCIVLQNAVMNINIFTNIKDQADQLKVLLGRDIRYDDYVKLIKSATQEEDMRNKVKSTPLSTRSVYNHDIDYPDDCGEQYDDYDALNYDIDSPIDKLQAILHNRDD